MSKKSLSEQSVAFVIPAYNESSAIVDTLQGIPDKFQNIIVVDDGSSDDTAFQVTKTNAVLVSHPINLGQGAALQTGIEYALLDERVKYIVTYDADGQHRIEDVEKMLGYIRKNDVDIVLGSRFLGATVNMPVLKRRLLKAAVWFSNITSGIKLTDTHNGLRVISRDAAKRLKIQMPDFSHASEIVEKIGKEKLRYAEVPVTIVYTDYSKGKGQSMINAINISFDVLLNKVIKR